MTAYDDELIGELQRLTAAVQRAIWAYPIIAARIESRQGSARDALARHRKVLAQLKKELTGLEALVPPAEASYDIGAIDTADQADLAAQSIETSAMDSALRVVGASNGRVRNWAIDAMGDFATQVVYWHGKPESMPGLQ